jgi:hypothetical protein
VPRKVFVAGEILTAADVNTFLGDQAVMVFDDAAARTTAIPSPIEGMVTYLKSDKSVTKFNGSAFVPIGTILQVVSTVKTDTFTGTNTTFADVTGLTVTITPSSTSSKVLLMSHVTGGSINAGNPGLHIRFNGGNASTFVGDAAGSRIRGTSGSLYGGNATARDVVGLATEQVGATFLDSPNTTSATTYAIQARSLNGDTYVINRSGGDGDSTSTIRTAATIIAMEVAG